MTSDEALNIFFSRIYENDIHEMILDDIDFIVPIERIQNFIHNLLDIPYAEFVQYVNTHNLNLFISASDITQCSSFEACTEDMCSVLYENENRGKTFLEIGQSPIFEKYIRTPNRVAWVKYGENQVKTACQLGLSFEYYNRWYLSCYGYIYNDLTPDMKVAFISRVLLRNPLYADIIRRIQHEDVNLLDYMLDLSSSTQGRRSGCVLKLISFCLGEMDKESIVRHDFIYPKYISKNKSIESCVLRGTFEETYNHKIYDEFRVGFIPIYSIRAACGYFDNDEVPEQEGWIDVSDYGVNLKGNDYFVAYAKGDSMTPKINDGDLCLFQWYKGGSRNGEIVLTQCHDVDGDYNARYTIKKYESVKNFDGEVWSHSRICLHPLNRDYETITLLEDDDCFYKTIGIFKQVLTLSTPSRQSCKELNFSDSLHTFSPVVKEPEENYYCKNSTSLDRIFSMKCSNRDGYKAPHKAIYLLSIIDCIEQGLITGRRFQITTHLLNQFEKNWNRYVNLTCFSPVIWNPIFYMEDSIIHKEWNIGYEGAKPSSLKRCCEIFDYLEIASDLWKALQDKATSQRIREMLIDVYITHNEIPSK